MSGRVSGQRPAGGQHSQEPSPEGECLHDGGVHRAAHSSLLGRQAGLLQISGQDHRLWCHARQLCLLRTLQDTQTGQANFVVYLFVLKFCIKMVFIYLYCFSESQLMILKVMRMLFVTVTCKGLICVPSDDMRTLYLVGKSPGAHTISARQLGHDGYCSIAFYNNASPQGFKQHDPQIGDSSWLSHLSNMWLNGQISHIF